MLTSARTRTHSHTLLPTQSQSGQVHSSITHTDTDIHKGSNTREYLSLQGPHWLNPHHTLQLIHTHPRPHTDRITHRLFCESVSTQQHRDTHLQHPPHTNACKHVTLHAHSHAQPHIALHSLTELHKHTVSHTHSPLHAHARIYKRLHEHARTHLHTQAQCIHTHSHTLLPHSSQTLHAHTASTHTHLSTHNHHTLCLHPWLACKLACVAEPERRVHCCVVDVLSVCE